MSDSVTPDGEALIKRWLAAKESLERARSHVTSCQCEVVNAQNALAKWLLPPDAKSGDFLAVWHGDSLYQAEVMSNGMDPVITVRTRGRRFGL